MSVKVKVDFHRLLQGERFIQLARRFKPPQRENVQGLFIQTEAKLAGDARPMNAAIRADIYTDD